MIRNALVALSALHKDYLCGEFIGDDYESPCLYAELPPVANVKTMGMISRCHRQLRNYLSRTDASPDVALISSVIFYTFESLLGESQRAIWHLDQGLILLRKCQLDKSLDLNDPLIPRLATLLYDLDLQASCFDDRRPPILKLATDAETKGHIDIVPDTFLDLTHAEAILTKLQNWTLHHLVQYVHYRGARLDELPSESLVERLVLVAQLHKFEASLARFTSYESLISNTSQHIRGEDGRQQRRQRMLLLRISLYTFSYLVKENILLLSPEAVNVAKKVIDMLPEYNKRPLSHVKRPVGDEDLDLERALGSIDALLSLPCSATSPGGQPSDSSRTFTLSTHLIAALYFLSLKTTNTQTLQRALALFSHPHLRHARDGLWDARTAAFLVDNLVKVRQNGNVTEGSDASDILMHISEQDRSLDMAELQRIFRMSEKRGLPMMQSKTFTLVTSNKALQPGARKQNTRMPHLTVAESDDGWETAMTYDQEEYPRTAMYHWESPNYGHPPIDPRLTKASDPSIWQPSFQPPRTYPNYIPTRTCQALPLPSPALTDISNDSRATPNENAPTATSYFQLHRPPDHGRSSTAPLIPTFGASQPGTLAYDVLRSQSATPYFATCPAQDTIDGRQREGPRQRHEEQAGRRHDFDYIKIGWEEGLPPGKVLESRTAGRAKSSTLRPDAIYGSREYSNVEEKQTLWETHRQRSLLGAG